MKVLFKTVHGSHLYGLNHADSDNDYFTVVDKVKTAKARYAKQSIVDGVDSTVVDFGTWIDGCRKGVPQYLEAMFSTKALHDEIGPFRAGFRVGTEVFDTYYRTIKSFALSEGYKTKRHALRLALNLDEMGRTGRFNPTLTEEQKCRVNEYAGKGNNDVHGLALCWAWEDNFQ